MMRERKRELIEYIKVLRELKKDGLNCNQELNQAVKELHKLMLDFGGKKKILIIEEDLREVESATQVFASILRLTEVTEQKISGNVRLTGDTADVFIYKKSDTHTIRGYTFDYVIDNTL